MYMYNHAEKLYISAIKISGGYQPFIMLYSKTARTKQKSAHLFMAHGNMETSAT